MYITSYRFGVEGTIYMYPPDTSNSKSVSDTDTSNSSVTIHRNQYIEFDAKLHQLYIDYINNNNVITRSNLQVFQKVILFKTYIYI